MSRPLLRPTPSPSPSPLSSPRAATEPRGMTPLNIVSPSGFSGASGFERSSTFPATQPLPASLSPRYNKDQGPLKNRNIARILRRFRKLAFPFWISADGRFVTWLLVVACVLLSMALTSLGILSSYLDRMTVNDMIGRKPKAFAMDVVYYLASFALTSVISAINDYWIGLLTLRWRRSMTSYFLDHYFTDNMFYKIQSQFLIDNPDQRIMEDIGQFTTNTLSFSLSFFSSLNNVVQYSILIYRLVPSLYLLIIGYPLLGTILCLLIGKAYGLVGINFTLEKREADFRYQLVRVRENVESIAFYDGDAQEGQLLKRCFQKVYDLTKRLIIVQMFLQIFTKTYDYGITLVPFACIFPMVIQGKADFGLANQIDDATGSMVNSLSYIILSYQPLASLAAVVERLGQFVDIFDGTYSSYDSRTSETTIALLHGDNPIQSYTDSDVSVDAGECKLLLDVQNLTLQIQDKGDIIIADLSLCITDEDYLLIMGPSGCGKTSLLRALAGLWNFGCGSIVFYLGNSGKIQVSQSNETVDVKSKPRRPGMFFLPQKPYMVLGSLRQQLLYPTWSADPSHLADVDCSDPTEPTVDDLIKVLESVNLGDTLERFGGLDCSQDWSSVLSLGEQQRLSFARLLLSKPKLVLLDESTSALDEAGEAQIYGLLEDADMAYISVAHRTSLIRYHNKILHLEKFDPDVGLPNWRVEPINTFGR